MLGVDRLLKILEFLGEVVHTVVFPLLGLILERVRPLHRLQIDAGLDFL